MANTVINKQKYLIHSKAYTAAEIKKYHLNIRPYVPVSADTFFGIEGYDKYLRNGHGVDQDYTVKDKQDTSEKGYAGLGYVADEHGVASSLDRILEQIDNSEGNPSDEWKRSPYTISSMGKLDTPDLKQQMSDIMRLSFSELGNIIWYPIISIENYQVAKDMELFKDDDYETVIKDALPKWFRSVHLNPDNMLWTADYHNNTDNPHIHLIFLEKYQTRTRGNFSLRDLSNLKEQFYSSAMKRARYIHLADQSINAALENNPQFKQLHEQMDLSNRQIRNTTDEFLSKKMNEKINQDIYRLYKKIDRECAYYGRMTYGSKNMEPFRKDINRIVDEILEHPLNKLQYEKAKDEWKKLDEMTKGSVIENPDRYQISEETKLRTAVANSILRNKKEIDRAYNNYSADQIRYDRMNKWQLKNIRKEYLKERNYSIDDSINNDRSFVISFNDDELKSSYKNMFHKYDLDYYVRITDENDSLKVNCRNENGDLYMKFSRTLLNDLQDHFEDLEDTHVALKKISMCNNRQEREHLISTYILSGHNQPDSEFFYDRKPKQFYNSYTSFVSSNTYFRNNEETFRSGSLLVMEGFKQLFSQRIQNSQAALKVENEARQYWENQQYLDRKKRMMEEEEKEVDNEINYGISI